MKNPRQLAPSTHTVFDATLPALTHQGRNADASGPAPQFYPGGSGQAGPTFKNMTLSIESEFLNLERKPEASLSSGPQAGGSRQGDADGCASAFT